MGGGVRHEEVSDVDKASENIQKLILDTKMPEDIASEILKGFSNLGSEFVAVRSSATSEDSKDAAWAGQLNSYLNVREVDLLECVRKCWASLFTSRAIFYRFEKGLHGTAISVAVVVQKMVNSEESGIAFSVHPVTEDRNQAIVEAGFGLGEAIVSGQITPDSYVMDKASELLIEKNVSEQSRGLFRGKHEDNVWVELGEEGTKQVLSEEAVLELLKLIVRIEKHYGFPVDIEWAREGGEFYITQSRPITTLSPVNAEVGEGGKVTKKTIIEELEHLDAPLITGQLLYESETLRDVPWTNEKFTISPYWYVIRKDNLLYLYFDPEGKNWKVENAGKVDPVTMEKEVLTRYDKIKNILTSESALNREAFLEFIKDVKDVWPWLECMFWMVEYYEKNNMPIDQVLSVRKKTEYFAPGIFATIRNSLGKMYPELGNYVDVLLLEEVISDKVPDKSILEDRMNGFAYTNSKLYDSFEDVKKEFNVDIENVELQGSELTGQPAYNGNVRGRVRLISSRNDMGNFQDGEILVASTTTPDFIAAMKKAGAIISEHGGAVCHAAITSRELKVPCVVGVKGATQILKDGDEVEVDADNGIVRILNRDETLVSKFKREIGDEELLVIRGKFIPLFLLTDWLKFYDREFRAKEGIYPVLSTKRNGIFSHYISLDRYLEISKKAIERYIADSKYKDEIDERYRQIEDKINLFYQDYFKKGEIDESELLGILRRAEEYLHELVALTLFIDFLDADIVKKTYSEKGSSLDFDKIFRFSEIYDFPSFDLRNNMEIVNNASNFDYLKHVYTGYSAAPTTEEVRDKIAKIKMEELKKEIGVLEQEIVKKKEEKKKLRENLTIEEKVVADFLSWVIELRDERKALMNKIDVIFNECTQALYEGWGIEKELSFVSYAFEVLKGKEFCLDNLENLKKRQGDFVNLYYGDNEYTEKYEDLDLEFLEAESLEKPRGNAESVTGQIANKGKARGFARIIYDPNKFHSFSEGDILVTSMTRPEFVPIMKKASGIVTNEGGIACHAAIVSRELGKPCVIGTKNATEVIRDGDLVEVDGDRGIVRVLEKSG